MHFRHATLVGAEVCRNPALDPAVPDHQVNLDGVFIGQLVACLLMCAHVSNLSKDISDRRLDQSRDLRFNEIAFHAMAPAPSDQNAGANLETVVILGRSGGFFIWCDNLDDGISVGSSQSHTTK